VFSEVHNGNLRRRIALLGGVLLVTPLLTLGIAGWIVFERMSQALIVSSVRTSDAHLVNLTRHLADTCRSYQQSSADTLKSARGILDAAGPITLNRAERLPWHARNEITGAISEIRLPIVSAGEKRFLPVADFSQAAPVVDEIERIHGTPATIFERMDERGDMLRISSSVKSATGTREIGSYIPISSDGQAVEAVSAVLDGRSHVARTTVSQTSYFIAYQPLDDPAGKVVGMLSTALPEEQITGKIRSVFARQSSVDRVGLFAWRASGAEQGTALLMADQSLEGQNLWNRADSSGKLYVQQICTRALILPAGETAEYKYQKPPRVGAIPQNMVARFAYVPELDWVVGYAQPEADFLAGATALQAILNGGMWLLLGIGLAGTGLAVRIWLKFARDLAGKLSGVLSDLTQNAKQVSVAAAELSVDAKGASGQTGAEQILSKAGRTAGEISLAIRHINASSDSVSGAMEVLDQIAFATNMLAVNSALEASQAEGTGQPIAGIAEELRQLAERCREAVRQAQSEIEQSRIELEKGGQDVLDAATLQSQAENLVRLAEGLDQTVERMSEYLESGR
jgi:hypothetical protein